MNQLEGTAKDTSAKHGTPRCTWLVANLTKTGSCNIGKTTFYLKIMSGHRREQKYVVTEDKHAMSSVYWLRTQSHHFLSSTRPEGRCAPCVSVVWRLNNCRGHSVRHLLGRLRKPNWMRWIAATLHFQSQSLMQQMVKSHGLRANVKWSSSCLNKALLSRGHTVHYLSQTHIWCQSRNTTLNTNNC